MLVSMLSSRRLLRRSAGRNELLVPRTVLKYFGNRSLSLSVGLHFTQLPFRSFHERLIDEFVLNVAVTHLNL
jgi:hypothetical protein